MGVGVKYLKCGLCAVFDFLCWISKIESFDQLPEIMFSVENKTIIHIEQYSKKILESIASL